MHLKSGRPLYYAGRGHTHRHTIPGNKSWQLTKNDHELDLHPTLKKRAKCLTVYPIYHVFL